MLDPEQDPEMQEALAAWFVERANPSEFAVKFESILGITPAELHLVAIQAKREEDARILAWLEDIDCPPPG